MAEAALLKKFMLEYTKLGSRLFRNNVGMAWAGQNHGPEKTKRTVTVNPGDIILRKARPFHGGFPKGSSDLIGWTTIEITPDMVGRECAIFTAVEAKTQYVSATSQQKAFVRTVNTSGGIAVIARKLEDLLAAVSSFKNGGEKNEARH